MSGQASNTSGAAAAVAVVIAVLVAGLALRGVVPAGVGVYYDDGVYLALGRSLAEGRGYVYANLPGEIPGVKYPPLYPAVLAAGWKLLPSYPQNLGMLKVMNAVFTGLAAALAFLVVVAAWGRPLSRGAEGEARPEVVIPDHDGGRHLGSAIVLVVLAVASLLAYGSAQTMVLATALLSEPLFLLVSLSALWMAGRRDIHPVVIGLVAAAAFLTRGIGVAVVGAVLVGELMRRNVQIGRRVKRVALVALGALPPMAAWIAWSRVHAGEVPRPLAGQYGSYAEWYAGAGGEILSPGRLREIASAHATPFLSNLEMLWIPNAAATTANFVLALLGIVAVVGAFRLARRNPALALFPFFYLLVVLAWPYEPDRFFYAIIPTLTLLLAAGGLAVTERIRTDMPRWGGPLVALVAGLLLVNSAAFEAKAHANRAWSVFQAAPATVFAPLNDWIRENTPPDAIVASGLDPLVYWETGRAAVPNFQFLAADYGRFDGSAETLAAEFDQVLAATGAGWVAIIEGEGKAGATMAAWTAERPGRARVVHEATVGRYRGLVYELLDTGSSRRPD